MFSVCKDKEIRFDTGLRAEVCAEDTWHAAVINIIKNDSDAAQGITVHTKVYSTSIKISWSLQLGALNVTSYDVACTSSVSQGQTTEVKVVNIRPDATTTEVKRLLSDTSYECCVTVHTILLPPIDMKRSKCVSTMTSSAAATESYTIAVGTAAALGICLLLISVGLVVAVMSFLYNKHAVLKQPPR